MITAASVPFLQHTILETSFGLSKNNIFTSFNIPDKVRVTKHVGKYSEEDVEVVFFIALNNYNTIPDVTTTPTAKHVHK